MYIESISVCAACGWVYICGCVGSRLSHASITHQPPHPIFTQQLPTLRLPLIRCAVAQQDCRRLTLPSSLATTIDRSHGGRRDIPGRGQLGRQRNRRTMRTFCSSSLILSHTLPLPFPRLLTLLQLLRVALLQIVHRLLWHYFPRCPPTNIFVPAG